MQAITSQIPGSRIGVKDGGNHRAEMWSNKMHFCSKQDNLAL